MKNARVLFLSGFLAAFVFMSRTMYSSVVPAVKEELHLTYAQVGLPPMVALACAAVGYALSGFLVFRFGPKKVLLMSIVTMMISALGTANSMTFVSVVVFQGLAGLSEGFFYVAALVMLTNTFENAMIGLAFGVIESALNLGILSSLTLGTSMTTWYSWRAPYQVLTGLGCVALCLILILARTTAKRNEHAQLQEILKDPYIRSVFIPSALLFLSFWSFWTFVPAYLVDSLRVSLTVGGFVSSFPFLLAISASLIGGILADRVGPKTASLPVILFYFVFLVLFSYSGSLIFVIISLAVVGFAQAYLIPVILSFVPKRFPQAELGRIFGIILSGSYVVATVGPLVTGHVVDIYGFTAAFLVLAICIGMTGLLIFKNL